MIMEFQLNIELFVFVILLTIQKTKKDILHIVGIEKTENGINLMIHFSVNVTKMIFTQKCLFY